MHRIIKPKSSDECDTIECDKTSNGKRECEDMRIVIDCSECKDKGHCLDDI